VDISAAAVVTEPLLDSTDAPAGSTAKKKNRQPRSSVVFMQQSAF
jgi:hypothetical protein